MKRRFWQGPSVRRQLTMVVLGLALTLGMASLLQLRTALITTAGAELDKRALSVAGDVALRVTDPLLTGNALEVREILLDTLATNPDVRYAFVVDGRGNLVAHTFTGGFPRDLLTQRPVRRDERPSVALFDSEEGVLHDAVAPVVDGLAGHVRVGLTQNHLVASLQEVERNQMLTVGVVGALALLVAYLLIMRVGVRIWRLTTAARAVGNGDLAVRVEPGAPDELGLLARDFNKMVGRLAAAQATVIQKEQARTMLLQKVLTAQEEERGRISRELHDEIGQALTGLIVGLRVLESAPESRQEHVPYLRELAAETLESVRRLSRDLRPAVLDDMGLVAALRRYTEDFARLHGIKGGLQVAGSEELRLNPAVETTLYRVIQEALTNIARHSRARHFGVLLDLRGPVIRAIVEDDGRGFDLGSARAGVGLAGMAERAALVGGNVTIESSAGGGTTIYIKVPLDGEEESACVS
ncbi:MAG: histidine kinase [Bacillota bacterium]